MLKIEVAAQMSEMDNCQFIPGSSAGTCIKGAEGEMTENTLLLERMRMREGDGKGG